ncbi:unnamed protein product, partial [Allacma fusca]
MALRKDDSKAAQEDKKEVVPGAAVEVVSVYSTPQIIISEDDAPTIIVQSDDEESEDEKRRASTKTKSVISHENGIDFGNESSPSKDSATTICTTTVSTRTNDNELCHPPPDYFNVVVDKSKFQEQS